MRARLLVASAVAAGTLLVLPAVAPLAGAAPATPAPRSLPSCTPELLYTFAPGEIDVAGSGTGVAASIEYTDAHGNPLPETSATVEWSARAVVDEVARATGVGPRIGGHLELAITTGAGEHLTFSGTCIAGAGAYPGGMILYVNGTTRGWTGAPARRTFVHFEAWEEGGQTGAYVAMIDGRDCTLNFGSLLVTTSYAVGPGSFTGFPDGFSYSETNCANRHGNPFPALRAPGLTP